MSEHAIIIGMGRTQLTAIQGGSLARSGTGGSCAVDRSFVSAIPNTLSLDDPVAVGEWIGAQLQQHGFRSAKVTVALGREQVVLKRLTLPTIEPAELPEMTRMIIERDLPLDPLEVSIDFQSIEQTESATTVLVASVPNKMVEFWRLVAKAAGVSLEGMSLRGIGAAALAIANSNETTLVIDITADAIEFSICDHLGLHTSRTAQVQGPQDRLAMVESVLTEARRTWMSLGGDAMAAPLKRVVLMGEIRIGNYAALPLQQLLQVPVEVMSSHPRVTAAKEAQEHLHQTWPLAGLLVTKAALGKGALNFMHVKRAPDPRSQRRMRRLIAAGVIVLAILTSWTFARQNLQALQAQATELTNQQKSQSRENLRYLRDKYKLEHLKLWESMKSNWLEHASTLASLAPSQDRMVLDSWFGALQSDNVKFARDTWVVDRSFRIVVEGEAKDRQIADAYRDALVQSTKYETETPGADARGGKRMPFGFTYRLRSKTAASAEKAPRASS